MAGAGLTAIAGCIGTDEEDDNLEMVTAGEETGTYAASQGMASVVNQNTDDIYLDARPSGGTDDNVGLLENREADIGLHQHFSAINITEGDDPFEDVDYQPLQVFHHSDVAYPFVTANEEWDSITDIGPDTTVSPSPQGSGTAHVLERALDYVVDDYDRVGYEFGDQSGAMQEGQLDVGVSTLSNLDFEGAWVQEMKQIVDTRLLGWPEDAIDEIEDDPVVPMEEIELTEEQADGYADVPDPFYAVNVPFSYATHEEVGYDEIESLLNTVWDNREEMAETNQYNEYFRDDEWWVVRSYEEVPFHPAAADFYEEKGLWRDEFERGEIDE